MAPLGYCHPLLRRHLPPSWPYWDTYKVTYISEAPFVSKTEWGCWSKITGTGLVTTLDKDKAILPALHISNQPSHTECTSHRLALSPATRRSVSQAYLLSWQACLLRPLPPNLTISLQALHFPHSGCWQTWRIFKKENQMAISNSR